MGLATAAGERLATPEAGADVEADVGGVAATGELAAALGVSVRVALGDCVVLGAADVAAAVGDGDGAAEPPDRAAQARVSDAAWAIAQTERLAATHELPSAAVRDSENRMKG